MGGVRGRADGDGRDLIIPSSSFQRVGGTHGTLGEANRWRCYDSKARNVATCDGPSACLITAHYGGKSDNNPHSAVGCSPDRSDGIDCNMDQLPREQSQT